MRKTQFILFALILTISLVSCSSNDSDNYILFIVIIVISAAVLGYSIWTYYTTKKEEFPRKGLADRVPNIICRFNNKREELKMEPHKETTVYLIEAETKEVKDELLNRAQEHGILVLDNDDKSFFVSQLVDARWLWSNILKYTVWDCQKEEIIEIKPLPFEQRFENLPTKKKEDSSDSKNTLVSSEEKSSQLFYKVTSDKAERIPRLLEIGRVLEFTFKWSGDYLIVDKDKKTIRTKNLNISFDDLISVKLRDDMWVKQTTPDVVVTETDSIDIMLGSPVISSISTVKPGYRIRQHDYFIDIVARGLKKDTIRASSEATNAKNAVNVIERIIGEKVESRKNEPKVNASTLSMADEIKKLKELLDTGVITQEEFEKMKQKIINA